MDRSGKLFALILVSIVAAAGLIIIIYTYYPTSSSKPNPTSSPAPSGTPEPQYTFPPEPTIIADVTLSPTNQTVVMKPFFLDGGLPVAYFNVTIAQTSDSNMTFPCSISLSPLSPAIFYNPRLKIEDYGTYPTNITAEYTSGTTISVYAILHDSKGGTIISDPVTVNYVYSR